MFSIFIIDSESSSDVMGDSDSINRWYPRDILRRTNWLYRVDSLRNHDIREMSALWEVASLCLEYSNQFVLWAHIIKTIISNTIDPFRSEQLTKIFNIIIEILQLISSEGYCFYLDFLHIAYYPHTNRQHQHPPVVNQSIDELSDGDARDLTGLSTAQLKRLAKQLRLPTIFCWHRRHQFLGEECLLHYLVFNRSGETKLRLSRNYFGGDPRRFSYSIRIMTNHIYENFYHKISGDSMRQWIPYIDQFRHAIWTKINDGYSVEESVDPSNNANNITRYISINIPFESFRIFSFLDDTGFRTSAPGRETRREYGFFDDVQRSFYSAYFSGHGLKVQALMLPNGMIGSVYVGAWRVSDSGLLNMSGLDTYLTQLFNEFNLRLGDAFNQFPACYGDGIFPQLATIIARYAMADENEDRVNRRLAGARQSIEHLFSLHYNIFGLFNIPDRFKLLVHGVECRKMVIDSFFLLNCYNCLNESPNNFDLRPPSIEEYLPLSEAIDSTSVIPDAALGELYNYYY